MVIFTTFAIVDRATRVTTHSSRLAQLAFNMQIYKKELR